MIDHSDHQTDLPLDKQVLNISVNMARIAYWTADSLVSKKKLIERFLSQTKSYLSDLESQKLSDRFEPTLREFKEEFKRLDSVEVSEANKLVWAEKALTWANILQHRAKLV